MPRPLVMQTEALDEACRAWLAERCEVVACAPEDEGFGALLSRAEGLVIRTYTRVDGALLERAPKLRVVGRAGVGLDNVDLEACRGAGVMVVSTPDANTRAVVELVTAFMLDAWRPRVFLEQSLGLAEWKSLRADLVGERQLAGSALGILGLGRIGRAMARIGAALDMRVIYHDVEFIVEQGRNGAEPVELDALLAQSDVLTVHIDHRASNRGFIDGAKLARMKEDALLINTSRGFAVDAAALACWLEERPMAQAVLDVHEPEPFGDGHPLLGIANAYLTPHIGAATAPAHRNMSWVVRDVWRVLNGEAPEYPAWV